MNQYNIALQTISLMKTN